MAKPAYTIRSYKHPRWIKRCFALARPKPKSYPQSRWVFRGLRPEAESGLDQSCIDLDEELIDISESEKCGSDRFATISNNLALATALLKKSGPISPAGDKCNHLLLQARTAGTAKANQDEKPDEAITVWPRTVSVTLCQPALRPLEERA